MDILFNYEYLIILLILILISIVIIRINKKDFTIKINKLIEYLGGKDNILNVESNMSRLNIKVKDTSIVNKDAIEKLGAKGIVEIDNELKIIMGPNSKQLKKIISRCHDNCKVVCAGHCGQTDLRFPQDSQFPKYLTAARRADFIKIIELTKNYRGKLSQFADEVY